MGRSLGIWRRWPSWAKSAAAVSAGAFASLTTLAEPPRIVDAVPVARTRSEKGSEKGSDPLNPGGLTPFLTPFRTADRTLSRDAVLADLGVLRWHQAGWRGQGVRVAVLDSGFRGYRSALGKHLPASVTAKSFRGDGDLEARDSPHGILCAEVVHAIAPEADILLANWEPDSPGSFVRALQWAKSEGAQVVTCSVIMPSWSDGAGGGAVHAALKTVLGDGTHVGDILFSASAGNLAERHWSGSLNIDEFGRHCWSPGNTANAILPWGGERVAVELYGVLSATCRLQVVERETGRVIEEAELRPESSATGSWGQAAVRFEPIKGNTYAVSVHADRRTSNENEKVHLVILGGNLETANRSNSIPFPGDGANVLTLGCVDEQRQRLPYSSCGPNSPRPKPDFVAQVPFPSRFRERPFTGTSAAAPQGAGLAALLLGREPRLSPERVREVLRGAAIDLHSPGHDSETGHGLLRLP
jgi:subtilisin family serine protease